MTIAHLITDLEDGGAQSVLYNLCFNINSEEVVVISMRGLGKYGELLRSKGIEVITLELGLSFISIFNFIKNCIAIKSRRFSILQCWMYHACLFSCILKIMDIKCQIYWGIHNSKLSFTESKWMTIFICRLLAPLSYVFPKKIIYCANYSRLCHENLGYSKTRAVVISNGYDVERYNSVQDECSSFQPNLFELSSKNFNILMVARYDLVKGHEYLFRALSLLANQIPQLSVTFIGKGVSLDNIYFRDWSDGLGTKIRLEFLGQINDLSCIYKKYDLLVMPSLQEAFPNVLCEAMASGVPCIASDVGDASIILDGTGWLVEARNSVAIMNCINSAYYEWLNNPDRWKERKLLARQKIVSRFDIFKMCNLYVSTWSDG